jgi:uncharacterized RDD family membrane protein YckC
MATRVLSKAGFGVDAIVIGRSLPSPFRRLAAFALDTFLIFIPSVAVALGSALLSLAIGITESDGFSPGEKAALQPIAPLLVRMRAEGLPTAVAAAVEQGDLVRAGELLQSYTLLFSISGDERQPASAGQIRLELLEVIPTGLRSAALFGTAALYFTLFTAGRRGSTPGKRLLGTEVVKLDGRPLTVWESFERFGGYLVSVGTLGIGLLDLWRDPNRRLAHDRLANTVVVSRHRDVSGG